MRLVYSGGSVSPEEVVEYLALTGHGPELFADVVRNRELLAEAGRLGIEVSAREIQRFADGFRVTQHLHAKRDMQAFLDTFSLTIDDFAKFCSWCLLRSAVKDRLADESTIEEVFRANRSLYDLARIAVILLEDGDFAADLAARIRHGEMDFFSAAREHSICFTTKHSGGRVGLITRDRLDKILTTAVAEDLFNAAPGDVVGPFRERDLFRLVLVEELREASLNRRVRDDIREKIVAHWCSPLLEHGIRIEAKGRGHTA